MATNIGKAYVQIVPSASGIKGRISKLLNGECTSAGESGGTALGTSLISKVKGMVAVAGIGTAIAASLSEGGKLQQSLGGIETMFKENADTIKNYASQAFQTAGVSANEYMENVTSFSAALISSLGGDTAKAAEIANTAMIDMSDNANKFGTDMASIQNAYQGFAKQNYTMLDNLKLGYGGTKTEMERLLADAEKLSGVEYDISNLSDVYEAIHVIQEEMGVTGTTAEEAASTLTGSFSQMKAAAQDLLGNLAIGEDITQEMENLVSTASTFLFGNLLPMVVNIATEIPNALVTGVQTSLPILLEQGTAMFDTLMQGLNGATGEDGWIQQGTNIITNFINGISANLPTILAEGMNILSQLIQGISQAIPQIASSALQIVQSLAQGLANNLPTIVASAVTLIGQLASAIVSNLPTIITTGVQIVIAIAQGLLQGIGNCISSAIQCVSQIASTFLSGQSWSSIGGNIISGIAGGIASAVKGLVGTAIQACKSLVDSVKSFFGIASPSRLFRDEVGQWIPKGMAVGIDANTDSVMDAMDDLNKVAYDTIKNDVLDDMVVSLSNNTSKMRVSADEVATDSQKNETMSKLNHMVELMETYMPQGTALYIDKNRIGQTITDVQNQQTALKNRLVGIR